MVTYEMPNSHRVLLPLSPPPRNAPIGFKNRLISNENVYEKIVCDHAKKQNPHRKRDNRRTFRTIVFSCLFLTIGFSIFILIMFHFGLLNKKLPKSTVTESSTSTPPTDPPATTRTLPTTIRTTTTKQSVTTSNSTHGKCAIGYTKFEKTGFCYKSLNHRTNFDRAQEVCKSEGGALVSIHSEEENDFLAALVEGDQKVNPNHNALVEDREYWIGLHHDSGKWSWVDGTPVDYTKWADGEPNQADTEPQVTMMVSMLKGPVGKHWNNAKEFSTQNGLICKKATI